MFVRYDSYAYGAVCLDILLPKMYNLYLWKKQTPKTAWHQVSSCRNRSQVVFVQEANTQDKLGIESEACCIRHACAGPYRQGTSLRDEEVDTKNKLEIKSEAGQSMHACAGPYRQRTLQRKNDSMHCVEFAAQG